MYIKYYNKKFIIMLAITFKCSYNPLLPEAQNHVGISNDVANP